MKNIYKFLSISMVCTLLFTACDQDETVYEALSFPSDAFVAFETNSLDVLEASTETITVTLNRATSAEDAASSLSIPFTVNTTAVLDVDYTILDNKTSFDFAEGEYSDTIEIQAIDNLDEDGNKEIIIALTEGNGIGFPGPDANGSSFTLNINDDDCSLVADLYSGTPGGTETSSSDAGEASSLVTFTVVSSTDSTVTYKIENLLAPQFSSWGESITSGGEYFVTFDVTDTLNPIVVPTDNGDPLGNGLAYFYAETDAEWGYYTKLTSGSFSTCGKTVDLAFSVDITRASTGEVFLDNITTILTLQF